MSESSCFKLLRKFVEEKPLPKTMALKDGDLSNLDAHIISINDFWEWRSELFNFLDDQFSNEEKDMDGEMIK